MADMAHDWNGLPDVVAGDGGRDSSKRLSYELSYADALTILRFIDSTPNVRELRLTLNDLKIEITREGDDVAPKTGGSSRPVMGPAPTSIAEPAPAPVAPKAASVEAPAGTVAVRSPITGVFYRSPTPGAPHFVEQGSVVNEDTVLCIIEVMKVMNNIKAGTKGVVKEICVANEELVQFDQTLFYIAPSE